MTLKHDPFDQLKAFAEELKRVEEKKRIAKENGAADEIAGIDHAIAEIRPLIGDAAVADAKREIRDMAQAARQIKAGNWPPFPPPPPKPDKDKDKDKDEDDEDGDGDGGGGGGSSSSNGNGTSGENGGTDEAESDRQPVPATCIYVRGQTTVWAWSRPEQAWVALNLGSDIVAVKLFSGGILAIARHRAALFDCEFGKWLTPLESPAEELAAGGASGESD